MSDYMKYPAGIAMTTEPKGSCVLLLRELFRSDLSFMYMLFKRETLEDIYNTLASLAELDQPSISVNESEEVVYLLLSLRQAITDMGD